MNKQVTRKNRMIDDGFSYLLVKCFTPNIGILFGSPRSEVQLEGEADAPKTLVYESTLQNRKWLDIKLNLQDFWTISELPHNGTIKDYLLVIAKHQGKRVSPELQTILSNPDISDDNTAQINDLFKLATSLFDDGHGLTVIETIGTLNPELKGNYSGGTSRFISQEFNQTISIADFTLYAVALREALSNKNNNEAAEIIYEKIKSLLAGIHDRQLKAQLYRELGLALIDKASETLVKGVLH